MANILILIGILTCDAAYHRAISPGDIEQPGNAGTAPRADASRERGNEV
jgi:hypothetical protein